MQDTVHAAPLPVITLALIVALLLSTELGRMVARRWRREDKEAGGLATGMLGIFALLIAFTYSLSLARYDKRRTEVLEEANAIGTTANYALMLPDAHRRAVMPLLKEYTEQRIALGAPYDGSGFGRQVAAGNAVLTRLWGEATAVTAEAPQSLPAYRFVAALNEQTNIAEARITALRNHVPFVVLTALVGIAMVSLGFAAWSAMLGGHARYVGLSITAVTMALLIALTIDLDRPNRGSVEISKQPLRDALAAIPDGG
ncbi:MAG: hypothetical protein INR65_17375 [Gluconacetobacter diazotrophicus]|nr:hypothetical protein [Gluconacetobacter diazotrophicus]